MIIDRVDLKLEMFDGEWKDDIKVKGTLIYRNGDKYKGPLLKDEPDGKGEYKFASGKVYIGEFKNGWIQGKGTLSLSNGTE